MQPIIFRLAAEAVGLQTVAGWMVGDNPVADIQGAADVRLNTIWVARGRNWSLPHVRPDVAVQTIHDALDYLTQLSVESA
jgi:putative hydrolase of the HAD superfamily